MPTVREILAKTTPWFASRGIDTPQLDAQLLIAHAMGLRRLDLFMQPERELTADELASCRDFVKRRGDREPVAYIVGRREFLGLDFKVSRDVLVPRPDTELLVEIGREFLKRECGAEGRGRRANMYDMIEAAQESGDAAEPAETGDGETAEVATASSSAAPPPPMAPTTTERPRFADIGTGSGAIAVCLAHELPNVIGMAVDLSEPALAIARDNATQHGVADRIRFVQGDLLEPLHAVMQKPGAVPFDLIVSNPPYVGETERSELAAELSHEPDIALFSGDDGLGHVARLIAEATDCLRPGGMLAIEIGYRQADAVEQLMQDAGWTSITRHRDLANHERVVSALRG